MDYLGCRPARNDQHRGHHHTDGAHLHMAVSDREARMSGGDAGCGNIVRTTVEAVLVLLPDWQMTREVDTATAHKELSVRPR